MLLLTAEDDILKQITCVSALMQSAFEQNTPSPIQSGFTCRQNIIGRSRARPNRFGTNDSRAVQEVARAQVTDESSISGRVTGRHNQRLAIRQREVNQCIREGQFALDDLENNDCLRLAAFALGPDWHPAAQIPHGYRAHRCIDQCLPCEADGAICDGLLPSRGRDVPIRIDQSLVCECQSGLCGSEDECIVAAGELKRDCRELFIIRIYQPLLVDRQTRHPGQAIVVQNALISIAIFLDLCDAGRYLVVCDLACHRVQIGIAEEEGAELDNEFIS